MYTKERLGEKLGQFNYIDKFGLMANEKFEWDPQDEGKPDALFRTSQAYVAYHKKELLDSLFSHCVIDDGKRLIRHPLHPLDDNSRDQTIMFMFALKFHRHKGDVKFFADNLKYKLSKRYKMTPTMWLWLKGLKGNQFANFSYQLMELISLTPSLLISWLFRRLAGFKKGKEYPQDNVPHLFTDPKITGKLSYKLYNALEYPGYALHLGSMMIYSVKRIPVLTWMLNKLFICDAEKSNYYIRLLNGDKSAIKEYQESGYKSMWNVRWSGKLDGRSWEFVINNYEKRLNTLDVDLMDALIKKENK